MQSPYRMLVYPTLVSGFQAVHHWKHRPAFSHHTERPLTNWGRHTGSSAEDIYIHSPYGVLTDQCSAYTDAIGTNGDIMKGTKVLTLGAGH